MRLPVRHTIMCRSVPLIGAERGASVASVPVGIRLSREAWARHSAAAQALGLPLSVYLRERLDEKDSTAGALAAVQLTLERRLASAESTVGILVELLLLLRGIVGPQRSAMVYKEVERQGLEPWKG